MTETHTPYVMTSTNGLPLRRRRRRADPFEWFLGLVLGGALVCSVLLVLAISVGCIWLIVVLLEDIARRLG